MRRLKTPLVVAVAALSLGVTACSSEKSTDTAAADSVADTCGITAEGATGDLLVPDTLAQGTVDVTFSTNSGDIPVTLDADKAPCTTSIIAHLAENGYYDNTTCHRITTQGIYVLQCGDPTGTGTGGPGFRFADEYPVTEAESAGTNLYKAGTIAMANAGPDTNGSQFFLNYQDSQLPPAYTLFGTIKPEGMETLKTITDRGAQGGLFDGPPAEPVTIDSATVKR